MIGQTISHYKILEKLGEGGMGIVYKAEDTKLKRTVALKFLPPLFSADDEVKQRFLHEAQAASALNHTNICSIHTIEEFENLDYVPHGGTSAGKQQFIDMEFVEGKTLGVLLKEKELSLKEVVDIALQIAKGLNAAHKKGIVHRDIKPDNIMVTDESIVKIMDFGLAKLKGSSKLTKTHSTLGTLSYMSPEQARGEEVDQRSDIFSFGAVLYEMITGRRPFKGEHEAAIMYSLMNETPEPLARYKTNVPDELQRVIDKALSKEKDKRYQHVDEMLADLRRVQQETLCLVKAKRKTTKLPLLLGTGIATVALVIIVYFFLQPKPVPLGEKSVAVLPFVDMSPQKDQEYFCDGMTEALINRLSNVQELRVPARTSAFFFKGKTENIQEIGDKLKVQTVLEGSVQKSGDRLRVTAQLINVADGYHLWSEKFDRELKDVFAIQDEISSSIVNALQIKLTSHEQQKISEHPIDNVKAYEYYRKADRATMRFDEKSLDTALAYLQTAIDIMGDNADLYSAMALLYYQYTNIGFRQEDYLEQAEEYINKALALEPDLSSALVGLGTLAFYRDYPRNHYDCFEYYTKALKANPNEIGALGGMELIFMLTGKFPAGFTYVERMERQDPLNPRRYVMRGFHYLYECQFGQALEQFKLLYQTDSTSPIAQTAYSWLLACNGKRDEALAVVDHMGSATSRNALTIITLLLKYALLKDKESALRMMTPEFKRTCKRDLEWSYWVANKLSLAGAKKEAMDWLENAIKRGFINYPFMQCDPFLNNIRGEERFKKLMEKAKYEWEHFEVPE